MSHRVRGCFVLAAALVAVGAAMSATEEVAAAATRTVRTSAAAGEPGAPALREVHRDAVCGKAVRRGPTYDHEGRRFFFCSNGCRDLFAAKPTAHLNAQGDVLGYPRGRHFDLVCGNPAGERISQRFGAKTYYFDTEECRRRFERQASFLVRGADSFRGMSFDPICKKVVGRRYSFTTELATYFYCSNDCRLAHRRYFDNLLRRTLPPPAFAAPPGSGGHDHSHDDDAAHEASAAHEGAGAHAAGSSAHAADPGDTGHHAPPVANPADVAPGAAATGSDAIAGGGGRDEGGRAPGHGSPHSHGQPGAGATGDGAAPPVAAPSAAAVDESPSATGASGAAPALAFALHDARPAPRARSMHTMAGIPTWAYYPSVAFILVLSFGVFEWLAARRERSRERPEARSGTRIDLLGFPSLRRLLAHPWTRPAAQIPVVALFVVVLGAGLFGDPDPARNVAPLLTWTIWWGALVVLIMYAGKAWCFVCPWDALAGWLQALARRLRFPDSLGLRWPQALRNVWPATALFVVLTWIEIGFGVTLRPGVTAMLGLAMVALSIASALVFERRSFCRYACLVGRISGLYALFAPVELRSRDRERCRTCPTSSCLRGNAAGLPCPTGQHLGRMEQNTYCIQCLECLRTCEFDNVALRLRPWATDLAHQAQARADEAYLSLCMLALTSFHGLTMTRGWATTMEVIATALRVDRLVAFTLGMAVSLTLPIALYAALVALSRALASGAGGASLEAPDFRTTFIRYAYALLPIALFYHLAHNSEHLLMEGPKLLALLSDPFGFGWDLFATARWSLPPALRLPTLWIFQVLLVVVGHVYSLWVARRAAGGLFGHSRAALRSQLPMLAAMVLYSLFSLWLLKQPMEMRSSAM